MSSKKELTLRDKKNQYYEVCGMVTIMGRKYPVTSWTTPNGYEMTLSLPGLAMYGVRVERGRFYWHFCVDPHAEGTKRWRKVRLPGLRFEKGIRPEPTMGSDFVSEFLSAFS